MADLDSLIASGIPWAVAKEINTSLIASAAGQVDVVAAAGTLTRASGSFITDGFEVGNGITGSAFTNGGNNANFVIDTVTALVITVQDNTGMADESGGSNEVITGRPIADNLIAFGVAPQLAAAIVAADASGTPTVDIPNMMSLGFPARAAQDVYDALNP